LDLDSWASTIIRLGYRPFSGDDLAIDFTKLIATAQDKMRELPGPFLSIEPESVNDKMTAYRAYYKIVQWCDEQIEGKPSVVPLDTRDESTNPVATGQNQQTTTGLSPPANEESIPIEDDDEKILRELERAHPRLCNNYDLETATGITRKTIGKHLSYLIGKDLAARPKGKRAGTAITPKGTELLKKLGSQNAP
jgi:predicted transcriptional regulator